MMLRDSQDAYGHLVLDYLQKGRGQEIVEREDGLLDTSGALPGYYFAEFRSWAAHERKAMRFVKGRVLDIGCGAGRVALYLQKRGFDVIGIDVSPLVVKVCKLRGLKKVTVLSISNIGAKLGKFDTLLMFGNNFGLFGSFGRARLLLRRLYELTSDDARIIAESIDPYKTRDPLHLAYHKLNRSRGRMSGQIRIRVRYRTYMTPWFDYLLVSKREMHRIIAGTGWCIQCFIDSTGSQYIAIIRKRE
ncbi:MAG: class I SAM-dependent methyltransferase [Candidatus Bathyarchaeia archaeon]|jgi:SAM-dependent methyltransferase